VARVVGVWEVGECSCGLIGGECEKLNVSVSSGESVESFMEDMMVLLSFWSCGYVGLVYLFEEVC
jgi:hypothetical protein